MITLCWEADEIDTEDLKVSKKKINIFTLLKMLWLKIKKRRVRRPAYFLDKLKTI